MTLHYAFDASLDHGSLCWSALERISSNYYYYYYIKLGIKVLNTRFYMYTVCDQDKSRQTT